MALIGVVRDGLDTLEAIVLGSSVTVALLNSLLLLRGVFGRVILSFAPDELRVRQRPALLSVALAIPKPEIRSLRVCARGDQHERIGRYDLVIERSRHGTERILGDVKDVAALVALAEQVGSRLGVKCETRGRS